jgi:hypothetical protein
MIEEDGEYDPSQDTLCYSQPHTYDLFSTLAAEADEFDDLFGEPPDDEEEYEDFEALLDGTNVEGVKFEFEDLLSTKTPRDTIFSNEDALDDAFGNDEMDMDMIFQEDSDSCGFGRESRRSEILLDTHYDRAMEMQIENESMLI